MKKRVTYTNLDNEDFTVSTYGNYLKIDIVGGNHMLFLTCSEVEEFIEILREEAKKMV